MKDPGRQPIQIYRNPDNTLASGLAHRDDPAIERWMSVDPLAEKYPALSTYNYVANNPIIFLDRNSQSIEAIRDTSGNIIINNQTGVKEGNEPTLHVYDSNGKLFNTFDLSKNLEFAIRLRAALESIRSLSGGRLHSGESLARALYTDQSLAQDIAPGAAYFAAGGAGASTIYSRVASSLSDTNLAFKFYRVSSTISNPYNAFL